MTVTTLIALLAVLTASGAQGPARPFAAGPGKADATLTIKPAKPCRKGACAPRSTWCPDVADYLLAHPDAKLTASCGPGQCVQIRVVKDPATGKPLRTVQFCVPTPAK